MQKMLEEDSVKGQDCFSRELARIHMLISLEGFEIIGEAITGQQGFGVFLVCPFAGFMVFTKEAIWQCNQDLASPWSA